MNDIIKAIEDAKAFIDDTNIDPDELNYSALALVLIERITGQACDYAYVDFKAHTITYLPIDDNGDTFEDILIQL